MGPLPGLGSGRGARSLAGPRDPGRTILRRAPGAYFIEALLFTLIAGLWFASLGHGGWWLLFGLDRPPGRMGRVDAGGRHGRDAVPAALARPPRRPPGRRRRRCPLPHPGMKHAPADRRPRAAGGVLCAAAVPAPPSWRARRSAARRRATPRRATRHRRACRGGSAPTAAWAARRSPPSGAPSN